VKTELKKEAISKSNGRCAICGKILTRKEVTIDHMIPKSKGGLSDKRNLFATHQACNVKKGKMVLDPEDIYRFINDDEKEVTREYFNKWAYGNIFSSVSPLVYDRIKLEGEDRIVHINENSNYDVFIEYRHWIKKFGQKGIREKSNKYVMNVMNRGSFYGYAIKSTLVGLFTLKVEEINSEILRFTVVEPVTYTGRFSWLTGVMEVMQNIKNELSRIYKYRVYEVYVETRLKHTRQRMNMDHPIVTFVKKDLLYEKEIGIELCRWEVEKEYCGSKSLDEGVTLGVWGDIASTNWEEPGAYGDIKLHVRIDGFIERIPR
jgi:hypothetical protein